MSNETAKVIRVETASEPMRPFFTMESLAAYLSLSTRTVRDMLKQGVIPSYKIGGARRIEPAAVAANRAKHRQENAARRNTPRARLGA